MIIADLIKMCSFEQVNKKILLHYGDKDNCKFQQLFYELKRKAQLPIKEENLAIIIKAFQETEDDSIHINTFDEDDATLYFDVSGFVEGEEMLYSIASSHYEDFLAFTIHKETTEKFSPETILAHALYEITAYGFEKDN